MIDREARRRVAELLRHVATGQIRNDEFCNSADTIVEPSKDPGLWAGYGLIAGRYDDLSPWWCVRYRGRFRLPKEIRRRVAITALFLYSDSEYKWPPSRPAGACLDALLLCAAGVLASAGLLLFAGIAFSGWFVLASLACWALVVLICHTSGKLVVRCRAQWEQAQSKYGDYDVWPFLTRAEFDEARRHPPLLGGRR